VKHTLTILFAVLCCSFTLAQTPKDSGAEPKSTFEVTINGKKYQMTENEPLKLDTSFSKPTINIKVSDYKKFDNSIISFQYPKHLSYQFEQDYGYKIWTLSGNDFVVMLFEMDTKTSLDGLTEELVKKFGKSNCVVTDFRKELGRKKCDGKKITVTLIGEKLAVECFEVKLNDFKSRFIYFQNTLKDGAIQKESVQGFNTINSTINFN
jgi:hypothetical protein